MVQRGELLEWAEFVGRRYGTPRRYIEECLEQGQTVILDIDIQGAAQIRAAHARGGAGAFFCRRAWRSSGGAFMAVPRFGAAIVGAPVVGAA